MKNQIVKAIAIISVLAIGIIVLSSFTKGGDVVQDSGNPYVIVKTYEISNTWPSQILITNEDGITEAIELEAFKAKNFAANATKIHEVLNGLREKGYVLISSHGGYGASLLSSTYIFQRP